MRGLQKLDKGCQSFSKKPLYAEVRRLSGFCLVASNSGACLDKILSFYFWFKLAVCADACKVLLKNY